MTDCSWPCPPDVQNKHLTAALETSKTKRRNMATAQPIWLCDINTNEDSSDESESPPTVSRSAETPAGFSTPYFDRAHSDSLRRRTQNRWKPSESPAFVRAMQEIALYGRRLRPIHGRNRQAGSVLHRASRRHSMTAGSSQQTQKEVGRRSSMPVKLDQRTPEKPIVRSRLAARDHPSRVPLEVKSSAARKSLQEKEAVQGHLNKMSNTWEMVCCRERLAITLIPVAGVFGHTSAGPLSKQHEHRNKAARHREVATNWRQFGNDQDVRFAKKDGDHASKWRVRDTNIVLRKHSNVKCVVSFNSLISYARLSLVHIVHIHGTGNLNV